MDFKDWLALLGVLTGLVGTGSALLSTAVAFLAYRRDGVNEQPRGKTTGYHR